MKIKDIKESLTRDLLSLGYNLYDLTYSKNEKILQILIDKKMDLKEVESLSRKISKLMDDYDDELDEYILDVSSVGIERPIRDYDELKKALNSYIFLKTKESKAEGKLIDLKDKILTLESKDKNIKKEIKFNYDDIKFIRYAVEFKGE